jgi:hypothetical protein
VAETHVISGLKARRARIAGEIIRAQEIVASRTRELLAIDTVLRMFSPDSDPDMISPIRPPPRGLFFKYGELARLALEIMREAGRPVTLERIIDLAMEAKGLPDDTRLRKHVTDVARQALMRMARRGRVRRILDEPHMWWELVDG